MFIGDRTWKKKKKSNKKLTIRSFFLLIDSANSTEPSLLKILLTLNWKFKQYTLLERSGRASTTEASSETREGERGRESGGRFRALPRVTRGTVIRLAVAAVGVGAVVPDDGGRRRAVVVAAALPRPVALGRVLGRGAAVPPHVTPAVLQCTKPLSYTHMYIHNVHAYSLLLAKCRESIEPAARTGEFAKRCICTTNIYCRKWCFLLYIISTCRIDVSAVTATLSIALLARAVSVLVNDIMD